MSCVMAAMKRPLRPLVPPLVALSILLAACTGAGPSPSGDLIDHPSGGDLVLGVAHAGGFVPVEFQFTNFPVFTLLGDGRVIVPGAQIEIFPGPALPAVNVRALTEAGIQALLREIAATGLFATSSEWRGAQNFIADASDTVFTLHADGREVTVSVYGLGTFSADQAPPNIPAEEIAVHRTLTRLLERLTLAESWLPETAWADPATRPYEPEAMRLLVRNAANDPPDDSGVGGQVRPWPIDGDPADFGAPLQIGDFACGVVSGEEAAAWYDAMAQANELTRWASDDGTPYQVTPRLLLPYEPTDCELEAA